MAPPKVDNPLECHLIPGRVHFWEVPFALMLSPGWLTWRFPNANPPRYCIFFFFFTLVTGPRRSLSLKLSDTRVYEPQIRARLGTTAHFCEVVVLKNWFGIDLALPERKTPAILHLQLALFQHPVCAEPCQQ